MLISNGVLWRCCWYLKLHEAMDIEKISSQTQWTRIKIWFLRFLWADCWYMWDLAMLHCTTQWPSEAHLQANHGRHNEPLQVLPYSRLTCQQLRSKHRRRLSMSLTILLLENRGLLKTSKLLRSITEQHEIHLRGCSTWPGQRIPQLCKNLNQSLPVRS